MSSSAEQCIIDITECPICNEVLYDNRSLPCLHTFCLRCLESYKKGKSKGKTLPCPICRRDVSIPRCVANLPRNFFIDKLIEAHNIKKHDSFPKLCDICSDDTNLVQAKRFCCECRQYLCLSCEKQHKKIKATASHKTIDSSSISDSQELVPMPNYCIVHTTKEAEVYCQECRTVICWQCKAMSHSGHSSIEISCAAKNLLAKLEEHIEQLSEHLRCKQDIIQKLTEREQLYSSEIDAESTKIFNEKRRLYRSMTDNAEKLKKALFQSTSVHLNVIQEHRSKLESNMIELKKHKVYIEQMMHLGNISDLCEYTDKLISKTATVAEENTEEISIPSVIPLSTSVMQDFLTGKRTDIDQCNPYKENADMSKDNTSNPQDDILPSDNSNSGSRGEASSSYNNWSLRRTIRTDDGLAVCGIAILDSMVCVVSQNSNTIRLYSMPESVFLTNVTVNGLVNPNDIVSCSSNNCLYACDWSETKIFKVEIRDTVGQMNWSTDGDRGCLSITAEFNVLLAGYTSNKLKEYSDRGELKRVISLEDGFKPWHAIKLVSGDFVISQGHSTDQLHRVCLSDSSGKIKISFGGSMGSDKEHLCGPYHLEVDKRGCILVNDCNNRRIVLLSPSLTFITEIIPSSAKVLRRARRMFLDKDVGVLYVADNRIRDGETEDGRILVFSGLETLHLSNRMSKVSMTESHLSFV